MKRFACLCGGLAALMAVQSAAAQVVTTNGGLAVWYDVRPTVNEITVAPVAPFTRGQSLLTITGKKTFIPNVAAGNAGGPGDGQCCRISPRLPLIPSTGFGGHVTRQGKKNFVDNSVRNIYCYITVEANGAGLDQVISALGRDTDLSKGAGGNTIESVVVTPDAAQWSAGGTTASVVAVGDNFTLSAKSVKIPVSAGPVYDATGGAITTGVYRVACIRLTAGAWNKGSATEALSTYSGHDSVNNLLMTRAVSSGGPAPVENPDFGYLTVDLGDVDGDGRNDFATGSNGGIPEAANANLVNPGLFTGSDIGASSVADDFHVIVQMKGDFNGDGTVTSADVVPFNNAVLATVAGTIRQRGTYLGDLTNDGLVTSADVVPFNERVIASLGDCTTNPGVDCLPSGLPVPTCPAP